MAKCNDCKSKFSDLEGAGFPCPNCGSKNISVELEVANLTAPVRMDRISRDLRAGFEDAPVITTQAIIAVVDQNPEGSVINFLDPYFHQLVETMLQNRILVYEQDWRRWEQILAAAYSKAGYHVTLTPRSRDKGRDLIAEKKGVASVKILGQMKRYREDRRISLQEVDSLLGTFMRDEHATHAVFATTSSFAPGIFQEDSINRLIPNPLKLMDIEDLMTWFRSLYR